MTGQDQGIGKCVENHPAAYGYPARPAERFGFCSQCGNEVIWECSSCGAALPNEAEDLERAQFCRLCGSAYFKDQKR